MSLNWNQLLKRMAGKGRDGKYLSACTGEETDVELRELILRMIANCSVLHSIRECVFRPLTGLSHASQQDVVKSLSREACLQMLADERDCRNCGGGRNCQVH